MIEIINARIENDVLQRILVNDENLIEQILPMGLQHQLSTSENREIIDVAGDWISLGGIDLQINGCLGLAFPDLNAENAYMLPKICEYLYNCGVDGFLPTLVTTSVENIHRSLAIIDNYINNSFSGSIQQAEILGVHLEGPFLNYQKRGAHPAEYLLPLEIAEVKRVLGDYSHIVKIITLAPELDPTGEVISHIPDGIIISLGHSQATATQAQQAFNRGATMVTHAFNAMPPLHHRQPGLLGAAITNPNVMCGFIADGEHVSPMMLDILLRASSYQEGAFLVSDALSPLGLPDGTYPWDSREIEVVNGTARLTDGTLSGTTLPLLVGVQNLVKWGLCEERLADAVKLRFAETIAIALATEAPRKAIGLPGMGVGSYANHLLRWSFDLDKQQLHWQRLL
ncbi:N-acetylglucosamine-6-phosphate deacetylase [Calothrix sp. PCC 6303]|uniref:N-acetylglucosamine-6-phosphate deacetylase n=1 Tax=Calothrix sp. PCC 6303 TaxID=1170562 RepID=UPI0002A04266|nr:N-acetylglucosamine-6-phosphate deacetylase [Calothrix sp. PCC 6303]AFY99546.1 N-acetylglucosamine 6-phosphate deacetylase [Calothrix sp. PCC 6303]